MSPRTRRAARNDPSTTASLSTTPTIGASPTFSCRTSPQVTPDTSEPDEEAKVSIKRTRAAIRKVKEDIVNVRKRGVEDVEEDTVVASKRRRTVYVEIKTPNYKVTQTSRQQGAASKARHDSPDEDVPDSEPTPSDDSDDSGSEYEASDDDEVSVGSDGEVVVLDIARDEFAEAGIDDDDVMLDAAIQESLSAAIREQNGASASGAGPSSSRAPTNKAATLRAQAAERRLGIVSKDEVIEVSDSEHSVLLLDSAESEFDEPLAKAAKKGKGKAKPSAKKEPATNLRELRKQRRQEAKLKRGARSKEEAELRKKLGRKLTPAEKTALALRKEHPELVDVWGDLEATVPIVVPEKDEQPANLKVTLLPFQQESLYWMKEQEQGPWKGGILADEMGMGKTIQMIALLVSDHGAKPNLVVAPTVAIMQWRNEIASHTDGLNVLVWHGASRMTDVKELKKYDVVLTTYAVLESCFRKQQNGFKRKGKIIKEKSPMHIIKWNRIILDEAHNIKDRGTNTAKATFELQAEYRWCLSGTPLQNRVGELYSLIRFLGGDPFSYYFCKKCDCKSLHWKFSDKKSCDDCGHSPMSHTCFWNSEILSPIQKNAMLGPGKVAFKKLRILLDRMMLRRTKLERADDLDLPPRTIIVRRDYFSPEEKELYLSLFSDATRQFSTYVDSGTVLNNYSNIFSLLTRMRQMACHPDLVLRSKTNAGTFLQAETGEGTVCRICNDIAEDAIQAKCRHIFDRECIKQYLNTAIESNPACPVCHLPLTIDLEAPALELEPETIKVRQGILGRLDLNKWRSSTKIEALVEELTNLRKQDATTKSIVFSQFVNFLDLINYRLQKAGFVVCRLEGTMSPAARDATIQYFMNNVHVTVFLVSLKAGGVALNLTEASRVFLMDSWWNPAVEYQAMDRIHRLGQHRPVQAIKLVVEDSIESRIIQLQEKKSAMVDATLSADDSAMGRLTPEDLGFLFRL